MSTEAIRKLIERGSAGVYHTTTHVAVAEAAAMAKAAGLAYFHLEGARIEKKSQFLNHAAVAMHFPDYFGKNWDAFEECITDLSWIDARGYVIYFDHIDAFQQHHRAELETLVEIFQDAVEAWGETPFIVLLHGTSAVKGARRV